MITIHEIAAPLYPQQQIFNHSYILPFLKELTSKQEQWEEFLSMIIKNCFRGDIQEELLTSCVVNLCALMIIFNGKDRAIDYMKALTFSACYPIICQSHTIYIHHIGSEHALLEINEEYRKNANFCFSEEQAKETNKIKECWNKFAQGMHDGKRESAEKILEVNERMIAALSNEIQYHEQLINGTESFVYQIMIRAPTITFENIQSEKKLSRESLLECYHSFVIEQYQCSSGEVRYFLYHAWIGQFSLADHIQSKSSDNKDSMSKQELDRFFDSLLTLLVQHKTKGNLELLREAEFNCFGVRNHFVRPPMAFNGMINAFSGKSLRYMTTKITPEICRKNYQQFMEICHRGF
jgi:hypothetical protein